MLGEYLNEKIVQKNKKKQQSDEEKPSQKLINKNVSSQNSE